MNTARKPAKEVDLRVVLRESTHNQRARAILRRYYRGVLDMTQEEFAAELSKEFHGRIALTTLNGYLTGKSNVPGAVLLAAEDMVSRVDDTNPPRTTEERLDALEDAALYEPTGRKPKRRGRPSMVR